MTKIYLNIRKSLTLETRNKMKKICKERGLDFGQLLNETFK